MAENHPPEMMFELRTELARERLREAQKKLRGVKNLQKVRAARIDVMEALTLLSAITGN